MARIELAYSVIFGSTEFGKAKVLLDERNLHAFGDKSDPNHINGHHIKLVDAFPKDKNYIPKDPHIPLFCYGKKCRFV